MPQAVGFFDHKAFTLYIQRHAVSGISLQLDGVSTGFGRRLNHTFGQIQILIMVAAQFGNNIGLVLFANPALTQLNGLHHTTPLVTRSGRAR